MLSTKSLFKCLIILSLALGIQGCTDDEALTTLTDVAIIGGAVAIGVAAANAPAPVPPDRGPYRGPDRGPGPGPRPGPRGYADEISVDSVASISLSSLIPQTSETQKMAEHYNLPLSAAQTLTSTLQEAVQTRSLQPVYDLGLSDSDLQDIGENVAVSNVAINNISAKLSISADLAKSVLQQMQKDARSSLYAHH